MPTSSILWRTVWPGATSVTWVSTVGVKTNVIKRSQAQGPTIAEVVNQMRNGCHGMRGVVGGLVGKASQKLTQAFPDLSVQFASPPSLIRNVSNLSKCRAYSWSPTRNRYSDETKTTADFARFYKYQLACWNMQWVTHCGHATLIHEHNHSEIHSTHAVSVTHTHT